jgi:hypothetical protein
MKEPSVSREASEKPECTHDICFLEECSLIDNKDGTLTVHYHWYCFMCKVIFTHKAIYTTEQYYEADE